jgi:holo-[acyl-carrier protein] synthase
MNRVRSGLDMVEIQRLDEISEGIRERFLTRVFTSAERAASTSTASLAGRFAAKEAVAKVLGCGIGFVHWQDIEILSSKSGEPFLKLHGKAIEAANQLGIIDWSISITHTRSLAAAVAVALCSDDDDSLPDA